MFTPSSTSSLQRAFTLIELLVVITIIAVLAGLLLPVASRVMVNAQKTQAKTTELQIVNAVESFKTEYGVYPMPTDAPTGVDVCFGAENPTEAELFHILRADNQNNEATINPRGIVFIQLPNAKNQQLGLSKSGLGSGGMLYDPWGRPFLIGVDADYDGTVQNPYSKNAGAVPLKLGVIVYSWGPDTLTTSSFFQGGGDKNDPVSADDVLSWQ